MKTNDYTEREWGIIRAAACGPLTDEEFHIIYNKAVCKGDEEVISLLYDCYPEAAERVFSSEFEDKHRDPAEFEGFCRHPILLMTARNTPARIADTVTYLTGTAMDAGKYREALVSMIPYKLTYNSLTCEYIEDFCGKALWEQFFLARAEYRSVIEHRSIRSYEELVERASAYFEAHMGRNHTCKDGFCSLCKAYWSVKPDK